MWVGYNGLSFLEHRISTEGKEKEIRPGQVLNDRKGLLVVNSAFRSGSAQLKLTVVIDRCQSGRVSSPMFNVLNLLEGDPFSFD